MYIIYLCLVRIIHTVCYTSLACVLGTHCIYLCLRAGYKEDVKAERARFLYLLTCPGCINTIYRARIYKALSIFVFHHQQALSKKGNGAHFILSSPAASKIKKDSSENWFDIGLRRIKSFRLLNIHQASKEISCWRRRQKGIHIGEEKLSSDRVKRKKKRFRV